MRAFSILHLGRSFFWSILTLAALSAQAQSSLPNNFTIEGRLYTSSGSPLNSSVDLQMELLVDDGGTSSCVLYRESFLAVDVSSANEGSKGVFAIRFGSGNMEYPGTRPSFAKLFSPGTFSGVDAGSSACSVTDYGSAKHRLVRVKVRPNGGGAYEALSPDTRISPVPSSLTAETIQGLGTGSLLQANMSSAQLSQVALENVFSTLNLPKLEALLAGTSGQYLPQTPTAALNFNNQRVINVATGTGANDATNKGYVDSRLGGAEVDFAAVGTGSGGGRVVMWDSTLGRWTTGMNSSTDATKLPLAGVICRTIGCRIILSPSPSCTRAAQA